MNPLPTLPIHWLTPFLKPILEGTTDLVIGGIIVVGEEDACVQEGIETIGYEHDVQEREILELHKSSTVGYNLFWW